MERQEKKLNLLLKYIGYLCLMTIVLDLILKGILLWRGTFDIADLLHYGSRSLPDFVYCLFCIVPIFKKYAWVNFPLIWMVLYLGIGDIQLIRHLPVASAIFYDPVLTIGMQFILTLPFFVYFYFLLVQKVRCTLAGARGYQTLFTDFFRLTYLLTSMIALLLMIQFFWPILFSSSAKPYLLGHLRSYGISCLLALVGYLVVKRWAWSRYFHLVVFFFFAYHAYITLARIGYTHLFIQYDVFVFLEALLVVLIPIQSYFEFRGPTPPQEPALP